MNTRKTILTDTPPGIAIPFTVENRLGKIKCFRGFPDDVTFERLNDNLDFQCAVQACLPVLPPVSIAGLHEGLTQWGQPTSRYQLWLVRHD